VARASEQTDLRDGRKIAASSKKFCFSEKIYLPFFGNIWLSRRRPDPARGAFGQSSPNAVRDAMDAFISSDVRCDADGEGVWFWHPWAGAKPARRFADDGD
jgi:hypothetical protein